MQSSPRPAHLMLCRPATAMHRIAILPDKISKQLFKIWETGEELRGAMERSAELLNVSEAQPNLKAFS